MTQVRDRIIPTNMIHLVYDFNPQSGYKDRGYGSVIVYLGKESIAKILLRCGMTSHTSKTQIDSDVLTMMNALASCQWIVVGEHLDYKHFVTQETPGVIGAFRDEAPRQYEDW